MNTIKDMTVEQLDAGFERGIVALDELRVLQLGDALRLQSAQGRMQVREYERLKNKFGNDHPRTLNAAAKIALGKEHMRSISIVHAAASKPQPDAWIVHGHVRTQNLKPVPGVTVALYTKDGEWLRAFGHDCTDTEGHFKLRVKGDTKAGQDMSDIKGVRESATLSSMKTETTATDPKVFLRVTDTRQALLGSDPVPLTPRLGQVDYREIILDGTVCTPPPGGDPKPGPAPNPDPGTGKETRFLGNSNSREVHDLQNTKKNCRIDQIAADYRVFFDTENEAVKARYDYCAYCFGKDKSKR